MREGRKEEMPFRMQARRDSAQVPLKTPFLLRASVSPWFKSLVAANGCSKQSVVNYSLYS